MKTIYVFCGSLIILLFSFTIFNNENFHKGEKTELLSIIYILKVPVSFHDNKVYYNIDTTSIHYFDDLVLYISTTKKDFHTGNNVKGTEKYFLAKKNKKYGFLFINVNDKKPKKLLIDSFLITSVPLARNIDVPPDSLYSLVLNEKIKGKKEQRFSIITKNKIQLFDSIIYYYDENLNHIPFSFSPYLDSLQKAKLIKYRLVYEAKRSTDGKLLQMERDFNFEIQNDTCSDKKVIKKFFLKSIKMDIW